MEPENSKSPEEKTPDEKKTFDMYHFFSRWDMMLAGGAILLLLLFTLYYVFLPKMA